MESSQSRIPQMWQEVKKVLNAHHIVNFILSSAFFVTKTFDPICSFVFPSDVECGLDRREHEILVFLGVVIFWKNRKALNWLHYLSNVFLFSRLASIGLFFRCDPLIGMIYAVLCLVTTILFPEPAYTGPERITYFQGTELHDELERNKRTVWFIEFYTSWSPECRRVGPVFAALSEKFTLPNLRFGKLDVGKFKQEADRFRINVHPTSRQLPTVSQFREGKEVRRRPMIGGKGRAIPFVFSEERFLMDYDLNNLYKECKENMSKQEKKQFEDEQAAAVAGDSKKDK
uniref:Thioredoxin domain-containing protein n=1 Tax=Plectus sambesii TaxID=2011161 RepID=A0A914URH3_9BILA